MVKNLKKVRTTSLWNVKYISNSLTTPTVLHAAEKQFCVDAFQVLLELLCGAGTNEDARDTFLIENPGESHLGKSLSALLGLW